MKRDRALRLLRTGEVFCGRTVVRCRIAGGAAVSAARALVAAAYDGTLAHKLPGTTADLAANIGLCFKGASVGPGTSAASIELLAKVFHDLPQDGLCEKARLIVRIDRHLRMRGGLLTWSPVPHAWREPKSNCRRDGRTINISFGAVIGGGGVRQAAREIADIINRGATGRNT